MKKVKSREVRVLIYSILAFFAVFVSAHIYYLAESSPLVYLHLYASKIWDFLFPAISAFAVTVFFVRRGFPAALLLTLSFSLSKLIYAMPFYYEYYVLDIGYTSADALLLSSIRSAADIAVLFIHIFALVIISLCILHLVLKKSGSEAPLSESLTDATSTESSFDFSSPSVVLSLTLSVCQLIYSLTFEIIDTVEFLKDTVGNILFTELITIIINYILFISLSLLLHFVIFKKMQTKSDA